MNRIVLIGNGFDKAHGLPTSYKEFIDAYWTDVVHTFCGQQLLHPYEDDFVAIEKCCHGAIHDPQAPANARCSYADVQKLMQRYAGNMKLTFRNRLLERLSLASLTDWVDVENEYYAALVGVLRLREREPEHEIERLMQLNDDFAKLQQLLETYLAGIRKAQPIEAIRQKLFAPLEARDIDLRVDPQLALVRFVQRRIDQIGHGLETGIWQVPQSEAWESEEVRRWVADIRTREDRTAKRQYIRKNLGAMPACLRTPERVLLLDFNYTPTAHAYADAPGAQHIHIHGELDNKQNPVLFGYGDELDDNYRIMEERNDNRYLEYIKSTGYHRTANYRRLLEFAESGYYQIFVMGHSCGNSDRTLLHTLFEHKNCISIKPFYHLRPDGTDNYGDIVRNLSRNFRDKQALRVRVVNRTYCEPLLEP